MILAGGPGSRSKTINVGRKMSLPSDRLVCSSRSARLAAHTSVGQYHSDLNDIGRRARVEIEDNKRRPQNVFAERQAGVQLKVGEVGRPHERRPISFRSE